MDINHQIKATITALFLFSTGIVQAALIPFTATIDGAQANRGTGTGSAGTGTAKLILDDATNQLIWDINWQLSPASTAAHIHGPASPTSNAGVKINLGNQIGTGSATLNDSDAADLKNNLWYVNIHSSAFGSGEIRGQLVRDTTCDPQVMTRKITQPTGNLRWYQLSLPCEAPFNRTMADLINDTNVSDDPTKWAAFTYQPDATGGQYQPLEKDTPIPPAGRGFWFMSTEDVTLTLPEGSAKTRTSTSLPCKDGEACFQHTIVAQSLWTMIGNAGENNIRHEDLQLINQSANLNCTINQPCSVADSSITSAFFLFNEFTQAYIPFTTEGSATNQVPGKSIAKPWDGYWAMLSTTDSSVTLTDNWELYSQLFPSQYMFVTDGIHRGDFGGIAAATAICNTEASNAGLPGDYRPWISAGNESPSTFWSRLSTPYVRPDGELIALDYTDLTDSFILTPISVTPALAQTSSNVWTHTLSDGSARSSASFSVTGCRDFTHSSFVDTSERAGTGRSTNFPQGWTESGTFRCITSLPIYCASQ